VNQINDPTDAAPASPFAALLYRWRWLSSAAALLFVFGAFGLGIRRVGWFSASVAGLGGDASAEAGQPLIFDPSMDIWFGEKDEAVTTYYEIEDRFVAEDYVMVTFEATGDELGVFSRESLGAIARLTESFLAVPGVRHVRSLTYNPWIRWGLIEDELGSEEGLIISDLIEVDPESLGDSDIVERMIAVLGARRTADRLGEQRVRDVIGADADLDEFIGEPLLLGTILNEAGTTTTIQVQVLRPHIDEARLADAFGEDQGAIGAAMNLYGVSEQRKALAGIEHLLRVEQGLDVPTPGHARLSAWVEGLTNGEERDARRFDLADPTTNFMLDAEGQPVRKFHRYVEDGAGYQDRGGEDGALAAAFQPQPRSSFDFRVGGMPRFERNFEEVGMGDAKFIPLMFLVITLVLLSIFRSFVGVAVPLVVVFGAILAMVGTNFSIGRLMNNLTMMSPNMLTAVGIADAIHLVASWAALRSKISGKQELIIEVIRRNALPVFLTSLTTAVGFYSLTVSELAPNRMLGEMASMGTLFAYLLSMTLVPALLSLVPHKGAAKAGRSRLAEFFTVGRSEAFVGGVIRRRGLLLGAGTVLFVVSLIGLTKVEIDSDFRLMFPDDNPTMSDFHWIEARMGGVGDLEIVFSGPGGEDVAPALTRAEEERLEGLRLRAEGLARSEASFEPFSEAESSEYTTLLAKQEAFEKRRIGVSPAFLASLEGFERRLREEMGTPDSPLTIITDLISPLDTLRKMNQVQNENAAAAYRVPRETDVPEELREPRLAFDEWTEEWQFTPPQTGSSLVAQYYLQYENGARPGESLTTQLSADRTQFRVQGRVEQASSVEQLAAFERIEEIARAEFPQIAGGPSSMGATAVADGELANMTLSGKTMLFSRTPQVFARGFIESMALALAAITILIGLVFRSVRLAVVSLIPNVLPIVIPLSAFGLLGIPLDGPAVLVSSVALGVCVDDTIHFFTKFVRGRNSGRSPEDALARTMHESGAAMTITTVVLIIGFGTLLLSDFKPNFQMGTLAGLMIGMAWIADFVFTTAVLSFSAAYGLKKRPLMREAVSTTPALSTAS